MALSQTTNTKWLHFLVRLPLFILVWLAVMAVKATVLILGFVMVALLYKYRSVPFDQVPKVFTPWKNPEDWVDGPMGGPESQPRWWIKRMGGTSFWSFYKYHAIRNPANGLRNYSMFVIDYKNATKYKYICSDYRSGWGVWEWKHQTPEKPRTWWYVVWYRFQLGVEFKHIWNDERYFVFKFGWRITPTDVVDGLPDTSVRKKVGSGFASKFLPYREYV